MVGQHTPGSPSDLSTPIASRREYGSPLVAGDKRRAGALVFDAEDEERDDLLRKEHRRRLERERKARWRKTKAITARQRKQRSTLTDQAVSGLDTRVDDSNNYDDEILPGQTTILDQEDYHDSRNHEEEAYWSDACEDDPPEEDVVTFVMEPLSTQGYHTNIGNRRAMESSRSPSPERALIAPPAHSPLQYGTNTFDTAVDSPTEFQLNYTQHGGVLEDDIQDRADEYAETNSADETGENDIDTAAHRIHRTLTSLAGCNIADHAIAKEKHYETFRRQNREHGAFDSMQPPVTFEVLRPPNVSQRPIDKYDQFPRNIQHPDYLRRLFEGVNTPQGDSPTQLPPALCIHDEHTASQNRLAIKQFDVDSFMGYPQTLAFAKSGISFVEAPQATRNVQSDLHHTRSRPGESAYKVYQTPHICLGHLTLDPSVSVYVCFPKLPYLGKVNVLTLEQQTKWYDGVFNPARDYACQSIGGLSQYFTSTLRHAKQRSKARQLDGRVKPIKEELTMQHFHYDIPHEALDPIWDAVLSKIEEPGFHMFGEAQLFFDAKNLKTRAKSPTLYGCIRDFSVYLERVIKVDLVDQDDFFIDVACDVTPPDGDQTTYVWKRCCIESELDRMYGTEHVPNERADPDKIKTSYTVALLNEAVNVTCQPRASHILSTKGLRYSQFYAPLKNSFASAKAWPFGSANLEELALDPGYRTAANHAGGSHRPIQPLQQNYVASKAIISTALFQNRYKSYGLRQEHRVSYPLLKKIQELASPDYIAQTESVLRIARPEYANIFSTPRFFQYIGQNVNKFLLGFEMTAAFHRDYVTLEATKLMTMFLHCLRVCVAGTTLSRELGLWVWKQRFTDREGNPRARSGLGWQWTMPKHGYPWFLPVVNWTALTFKPAYQKTIYFNVKSLRMAHRRRWRQVKAVANDWYWMEACYKWLHRFRGEEAREAVLDCMVHLLMATFRASVVRKLQQDKKNPNHGTLDVAIWNSPWSHEGWTTMLGGKPPHLIKGRASIRKPIQLMEQLWGDVDSSDMGRANRQHYCHDAWRPMYRRVRQIIRATYVKEKESPTRAVLRFEDRLFRALLEYHHIFPSPELSQGNLFVNADSKNASNGGKQFWSVVRRSRNDSSDVETFRVDGVCPWVWGKADWDRESLPPFPDWLSEPPESYEHVIRSAASSERIQDEETLEAQAAELMR